MIFANSIPEPRPTDIIAWADTCGLKTDGHSFDSGRTPQLVEPIKAMADVDTRVGTLIKPVQVGGSTAGEVVCAYWAAFRRGLLQYNWQDDSKAKDRWKDRIYPTLKSCPDIRRSGALYEELNCEARYPGVTVRVQGVYLEGALDSDTVPLMINEEIHLWKPGFLSKARRRQTQVWNSKAFDISNASMVGDQLHSAYEDGTMEEWEVLCPKCGGFHEMHFRFNPNKPELGGLRWDSDGCKTATGRFNYNKLEGTIRYQFPCGHEIKDHAIERRRLQGRYSRPKNEGAHVSHRSWNFEAVSCDAIRWITLIQEWHSAIRALKTGDQEPMYRFVTERECKFYSPEMRPYAGKTVVTTGARINRKGLPGELGKIWAADWQQGYKALGELTHYWLVIESVMPNCTSQVIYADKVSDEAELLLVLKEHGITDEDGGGMADGFIDASKNQKHILSFCLRNGINAVVGGDTGQRGFSWPDGSRQYFSMKKFIWKELNQPEPRFPLRATREGWLEDGSEPFVIRYNKAGLLKNHFFIREMKMNVLESNKAATPNDYIERIVPEDIGEDYLKHHEAWERDMKATGPRKMGQVEGFKQVYPKDHLMSCSTYIDLMKDLSGLLGAQLQRLHIQPEVSNGTDS